MAHLGVASVVRILIRTRRWLTLTLLSLLLFGIAACGNKQNAAQQTPSPPAVSVIKLATVSVTPMEDYPGQTEAVETVEIRPRVGGILERQAFKDGADVKKGDLLFVIDQKPFITALDQAKANLQQARATHLNSEQTLTRYKQLIGTRAISQQDMDNAISKEHADAASVQAGEAQVRQAQLNLDYTTIRSPRDGMISRALIKPGGLVVASTTLLTTLYSENPIFVNFTISEQKLNELQGQYDLRDIKKSPDFKLKLLDGSDYKHSGKLNFVDPAINPRDGTLPVRVVVPNPEGILRAGQFMRVIVPSKTNPNAILVPQKAVQEVQGKQSVYVVGPGNKAVVRDIVSSQRMGNNWVVERGLKPGELLIVEGIDKVQPGAPVKAVPVNQVQQVADQPGSPKGSAQEGTKRGS